MIIHVEETFKAMQCRKCRKYFKKKQESQMHLQKKHLTFFVLSRRSHHLKPNLQNPKPQQMKTDTSSPIPP